MNGIIILDKEKDLTSRDEVNNLVRILETRKIGHAGTLDPLATGVLVCMVGNATKLSNILINDDKTYIAEFKLGILTDTLDITGKIIKEKSYTYNKEEITNVINSFKGKYMQEVPKYSAVKIKGKPLYKYARDDKEVELPKREVHIKEIKIININEELITVEFHVSKGTYIRSLINDIAIKLGTYGTLTNLKRTHQGMFSITDASTINEVLHNEHKIFTIKDALTNVQIKELDEETYKRVKNGAILNIKTDKDILFTYNNKEIALYKTYKKDNTKIKPKIMF